MLRKIINTFRKDEGGTTTVEFAMVGVGFLLLIGGIFESARMMMAWNSFQFAVEEATRYTLIDTDATDNEIQNYIITVMDEMTFDVTVDELSDVEITTVTGNNDVSFKQIQGTYDYRFVTFGFLPDELRSFPLSAKSRMPMLPPEE